MIKIRRAKQEDAVDCVLLAKEFYKTTKYTMKFDGNKAMETFYFGVDNPDWLLLVAYDDKTEEIVGIFVACLSGFPLSLDIAATELTWYMTEEHRDSKAGYKLLLAYEAWAKEKKCVLVTMSDIHKTLDLEKLYVRKGYTLTEKTYVKEI